MLSANSMERMERIVLGCAVEFFIFCKRHLEFILYKRLSAPDLSPGPSEQMVSLYWVPTQVRADGLYSA